MDKKAKNHVGYSNVAKVLQGEQLRHEQNV
jgi:hypothetical protein